MRYRRFPNTTIKVSEIGFGVWTVSSPWWGIKDEIWGITLLRSSFEKGINFFDTADNYGNGKGETILAKAFSGKRSEIVISTKTGYDFYNNKRQGQQELPQNFFPDFIRFSCEQSLKRLETDYIDLYQLHNPRIETILRDDTFEMLDTLKQEGKIRAYGVALGPAINERQIEEGVTSIKKRCVASVQIIYNMFEQVVGPRIFETAQKENSGILVRVPHSSGLLEGKLNENTTFGENDHRYFRISDAQRRREWLTDGLKKVEKLKFLTNETGRTIAQAALKFVLAEPTVVSVLPNIYNLEQLNEFIATSDCPDLTKEELCKIDELYKNNFYLAQSVDTGSPVS